MSILAIDGNTLAKMIIAGSNALSRHRQEIDALNVFPVPDGDTGTNMSLTVLSAAKEAEKTQSPNIHDVARAASGGSLRGARGNSGVITSQLFRGFAKGLEGVAVAAAEDLARALQLAMETAYKAVMRPKEGTILTIARALAEQAAESLYDGEAIDEILSECLLYANTVLDQTPSMLPELKQAGVVDAGGKGLLLFIEGALRELTSGGEVSIETGEPVPQTASAAALSSADITYGYCTEFFIQAHEDEVAEASLKSFLSAVGDSIVVASDQEIIKVHVHTDHPGQVLERALAMGSLSNLKIENMRLQHTNLINFSTERPANGRPEGARNPLVRDETAEARDNKPDAPTERKEAGFVVVSLGEGLKELFLSLGADQIIEGGQTMNPSTEDILLAIQQIPACEVFVLPNNKNIIWAAQQAAELVTDKKVRVLPSRSIPEGISAMVSYTPVLPAGENETEMLRAMETVRTGQVTYAVRDTIVHGQVVKEGDILCLLNGDIVRAETDLAAATAALANDMADGGSQLLSLYYGQDVSEQEAGEVSRRIQADHPDLKVETYCGGQPLYYYILSVE